MGRREGSESGPELLEELTCTTSCGVVQGQRRCGGMFDLRSLLYKSGGLRRLAGCMGLCWEFQMPPAPNICPPTSCPLCCLPVPFPSPKTASNSADFPEHSTSCNPTCSLQTRFLLSGFLSCLQGTAYWSRGLEAESCWKNSEEQDGKPGHPKYRRAPNRLSPSL